MKLEYLDYTDVTDCSKYIAEIYVKPPGLERILWIKSGEPNLRMDRKLKWLYAKVKGTEDYSNSAFASGDSAYAYSIDLIHVELIDICYGNIELRGVICGDSSRGFNVQNPNLIGQDTRPNYKLYELLRGCEIEIYIIHTNVIHPALARFRCAKS